MKPNMGTTDRIIKVLVAMALAILLLIANINSTAVVALAIVAVVLLSTGFTGYCPLYKLIKVNTKK